MRIAALVKQVPRFEAMTLGPDGRLVRDGLELEMNPYCRRAVAKGIELAGETGGSCTVFTLGPPMAEDVLREAIACGADEGVLISDPLFAGSDTLASARALAAVLRVHGPFDLVLTGRNSVDADTGQVGPAVAELLDLPFASGVRELELVGDHLRVRCEHDDGWLVAAVALPAILSVAERLCQPAKALPADRAAVSADRLRRLSAADLGTGPWGQRGSPTVVGEVTVRRRARAAVQLTGAVVGQARSAVDLLMQRGAFDDVEPSGRSTVATAVDRGGPPVAVTVEPGRERETAELLGAAAALAVEQGGRVVAFGPDIAAIPSLGGLGANEVVSVVGDTGGSVPEEDVAAALARWAAKAQPWAILAPSTAWGREVAARAAARLGAGLTGDAVALESREGRLVALKPAFGGELLAAISSRSSIQMVTVRAGVLPLLDSRESVAVRDTKLPWAVRGRVRALERGRDDELETLAIARIVLGVGAAVRPDEYPELRSLQTLLGAELGASRKVTDRGWLPRARQIGITGRSIAPCLYIAIGIHGKFNHMLGVRGAGTVLAVNTDPLAPVFSAADVGIVADWHEAVPLLVNELRSRGIAGLGSNADGAGGRGLRLGGDADVPAAATVR